MYLQTERLILRPWQEEDAERLYQYAKDPAVGPSAGWPAHKSVEESRQVIRTVFAQPEVYAVCRKDGSPIGSIGLHKSRSSEGADRDGECELGYWLAKPFWGQGLIPEACRELLRHAFEDLHMAAVWCCYHEGNVKSARVQEKLGFLYQYKREGVAVPRLGEVRTVYCNLMTRTRWQNVQLFWRQKELLDTFLRNGAISLAQYRKSLGDLREKMNVKA